MTKAEMMERDEARAQLRKWLKPGDTVYCILRHCSRSGMQREIGLVVMEHRHGETCADLHPSYLVAKATGHRVGKHDGVIVGGCGMDMGFHLVYTLSRVLFPDGFGFEMKKEGVKRTIVPDTPAHAAALKAKGYEPIHRGRNGDTSGWDNDGGYALNHRWL